MSEHEAVDEFLDHVEDRENQLRSSLARLKLKVNSTDVQTPSNPQEDLEQAMTAGIMLPALPMK